MPMLPMVIARQAQAWRTGMESPQRQRRCRPRGGGDAVSGTGSAGSKQRVLGKVRQGPMRTGVSQCDGGGPSCERLQTTS